MVAKKGESSQNISRTDILCEGPVKGLKHGASSIFLNDVASDDSSLRGYVPTHTSTSGLITFNGSSATNTGMTGASIPSSFYTADTQGPRKLNLLNYLTTSVTVSNISTTGGNTTLTATASSGTPFTDAWNTQQFAKRTAYLVKAGVEISGFFQKTSSSAGTFFFWGVEDVIDASETYELRISYFFFLQSVTDSDTLSLRQVPAAGTYFFTLSRAPQHNSNQGTRNKIEGIQAQFRPGGRYQNPLDEIGGVGGSVAGTQSVNHELKVIGTGEISGISPVPENGQIGSTMESGLPDDSQNDVASEAVVLADTAFGITEAQRPEVDEISLRITYPGGLQSMNNNKGRRDPAYARYLIQIQTTLNGVESTWENAFPQAGQYVEHTGRTNAAYSFDHVLGLNQYRPFDSFKVRVIRLTRHIGLRVTSTGHGDGVTDKEKWTLIAKSKIDQLGFVIKDRLSYPYTSLVSTSFSSKQYQEPPKMSYLMQGKLVKVPTTYTPREYSANGVAQYSSFWNGTFKSELQYTDNPAWVFYDIVTNTRYGAGKWIQESDIDKYALYRIARYCDELVDNGAGGTEPRFRANVFLTKSTDVYKVLKDFASIFTGMLYWMDSNLVAVQDSPADAIYNFTKGNVIDGKFGYESTGLKTRPNQIVVTWNDPKSNYEPVPLIVEDREAIVRDKKLIKEDAVAFGCTSEAQAIRYGRWKLWTAQKQTEIISFKSAMNSLYIKPGDVVNVQDADRQGVQYSGRISAATNSSVTLDRSVTLNSGSTYTLSTLVTDSAAYYTGSSDVVINGVTYSSGERIPQAYVYSSGSYSLTNLDTEAKASNAFQDSSGSNLLPIVWKKYSYIQENAVTNSAGTTSALTVSSFGTTPVANTIWALKETSGGLNVLGSYKKYKVLSITQDKSNEYGFSCVEHYDEKYGAIDSGYATSDVPTSIYEENEDRTGDQEMAAPTSLRVILESDPDKPGEEIKLEWNASTSEYVESYEVQHNIPDIENPIRTSQTFVRIDGIPSDTFVFQVRAVSTGGNYSPYTSLNYTFVDPYEDSVPREAQGIPRGGFSTSQLILNSSNALQFQATNTSVSTLTNPEVAYTLTGTVDVSGVPVDKDFVVYLDTSVPALELLYYDTTSLSVPFYYDVGNGNGALSASWTSIGSVSISANSNTVTGSNFNTNVELGDILNLSNSTSPSDLANGAVVIEVVSDTELKIDTVFDSALSITGYRANFRIDYLDDTIIAKVRKTGSTISLDSYLTLRTAVDDTTTVTDDDGTISVGTINSDHIAANSITTDQLAANSITTDQLAANSITADQIAANSITTDQLAANSITADQIAANSITTDQLAANSITADQIAANSITTDQLAANSITADQITTNSITTEQLAANSITADQITANSVVASLLTASTIQSSHIKSNSIVSTIIDATSITASDITTSTLSALSANLGDITAGTLKGGTVPDANAAPTGSETGAFMNLTSGKMVFGNANKYILFDGTNLELNGVVIDASSTVNATAPFELTVKEDGVSETTVGTGLNFTTGLNVAMSGTEAVVSVDANTSQITENSAALYFTNARARSALNAGAGISYNSTTGVISNSSPDQTVTLTGAGGTTISGSYPNFTITSTDADSQLTEDQVEDIVGGLVVGGSGISATYNDAAGTLTISNDNPDQTVSLTGSGATTVSGTYPNFTISSTDTNSQRTVEEIEDIVGGLITAGSGIGTSYNDAANTLVITNSSPDQTVSLTGTGATTITGTYPNFTINSTNTNTQRSDEEIEDVVGDLIVGGSNITATYDDSAGTLTISNDSPDQTVSLTGSGATSVSGTYPTFTISSTDTNTQRSDEEIQDVVDSLITAGTGISAVYNDSANTLTITNTDPDQTVALTGGGATSISGTYPNFTISSTDTNTQYTAGTGLSLSGTEFSVNSDVVVTSGAQTIGGNKTFSNNVIVGGNLTVSGTTTYINTQTLNVGDNIITLNADFTGSNPTESAGIEVERGTQANVLFQYKESGVGITGDLAAGWSVGTSRIEATGFYGTFYGDASNLSNINADSLSGLSTADLAEDPSATTSSGTMYFTNARAQAAIGAGTGLTKSSGTLNVGGLTTSELAAGSLQLSSESFSDSDTVLMTAAAIQDKILSYGFTTTSGDITGVTAGTGLSGGGTSGGVTLNVDLSELTNMTQDMVGADQFIVLDNSADRRKTASDIGLSIFNNDSGFTTNTGTVTSVATGSGLTGGTITGSGTISHADTSSASSSSNTGNTVIQSVTIDGFGHVTGLATKEITLSGLGYSGSTSADNYGSWTILEGNGSETSTIGSGQTLHIEQGTGIQVELTATRQLTITNTAPDQTVSLTGSGATTVTGTYPNFTISSTDTNTERTEDEIEDIVGGLIVGGNNITATYNDSAGTLTITNTAPDQTVSLTGSGATSVSGTYPNFTISSTDTNTVPNNGQFTVSGGTDLSGSGSMTADQSGNSSVTINHAAITRTNTSNASSPGYAGNFTVIDSLTTNARGHVTGVNTRTITLPASDNTNTVTQIRRDNTGTYRTGSINLVGGSNVTITETSAGVFSFSSTASTQPNNATITISGGDGLQTGGAFTTDQGSNETITLDVDSTVVRTSGTQSIAGTKTFTATKNYFQNSLQVGSNSTSYSGNTFTVTDGSQGFEVNPNSSSIVKVNAYSRGSSAFREMMFKASSLTYAPNGVEGSKEDIVTVASGTSQTGSLLAEVVSADTINANMITAQSVVSDIIAANSISAQNLSVLATERVNPVSETKNLSGWGGVAEDNQSTLTVENIVSYDSVENAIEITNKNGTYYNDDTSVSCDSFVVRPDKIYKVAYKVKVDNTTGNFYAGLRYGVSPISGDVMSTQNDSSTGAGQNTEYEVFQRYDKDRNPEPLIKASAHFIPGTAKTNLGTTEYNEYVHYIIGAGRSVNDCPDFIDQNILDGNSTPDTTYPFIKVNTVYVTSVTRTSGGSGYTANGTNVAVLGGSGTGLTVDYTVSGGAVQPTITVNNQGEGYKAGDTLTIPAAAGETAAVLSVASVRDPSSLVTAITGTAVGSSYGASQTKTDIATAPDTGASPNAVGDGLTVNYQTNSSGQVILNTLSINNHGGGYKVGETYYIVAGSSNAKFTITSISSDNANVALRFLHYDNTTGTSEKKLYIKDISVTEVGAGQIVAQNIQISNNAAGSAGIFMDYNNGNSRIDIRDSSALRVRIGYLA